MTRAGEIRPPPFRRSPSRESEKKQRKKSDHNAQLGTLEVRVLFVRLTTRVLRSMIFKTRATDFAEKERLLVD